MLGRKARTSLVVAVVAVTGWLGAVSAPTPAAAAAPDHQLSNQVLPGLDHMTILGALPTDARLQVGLALRHPDPEGEQAAAEAIYIPGNPAFHHFIDPAQWAARFAVPQATFDSVVQRYTAAGFSLVYSDAMRGYVEFDATAAEVEQAMSVNLNTYRTADGLYTLTANAGAPTVPADVVAVTGLTDLGSLGVHPNKTCVNGVCDGSYSYIDVRQVYQAPTAFSGVGQDIGIIGNGTASTVVADLLIFEANRGLPTPTIVKHYVAGSSDAATDANRSEWDLDSQSSTSMAPNISRLHFYFSSTLGDPAAFSAWANDPSGPRQSNASFGGCESINAAIGNIAADAPIFTQLAAAGRTLFVSTGDTGGSCTVITGNGVVNTLAPQVEWPASSRWVTAVGGTMLYTNGTNPETRNLERAWEYTGGGSSLVEPEPTWQQSIGVIVGKCTLNEGGSPITNGPTCRGLPDVAALSGDITVNGGLTGFEYVDHAAESVNGGTSLSSPLWAGFWTRIQSAAQSSLGFAPPALYGIGLNPTTDATDFFDIAIGSNGQFTAIARNPMVDPSGWDYVSGLGTPFSLSHLTDDLVAAPPPPVPESPLGLPLLVLGAVAAVAVMLRRTGVARRVY